MIPKYIALKEKITNDIIKNKYPIGSNLPTELELSAMYQVSRSTVRQALALLSEQNVIEKRWGSGNIVVNKPDNDKVDTVMVLLLNDVSADNKNTLGDISSVLMKNGINIEFHETNNSYQLEREFLTLMLQDIYGGLIIHTANSNLPSTNSDLLQILLKRQTPVVFINSAPSDIYNPTLISLDNYSKGYLMARKLINIGHKTLGGIFVNNDIASVKAFSGFIDAIRDASLTINDDYFLWCNYKDPLGISSRSPASINRFLKNTFEKVSAVYCDDNRITSSGSYQLVSCDLSPARSIGKECAKAILELKKNGSCKSTTIPYKSN